MLKNKNKKIVTHPLKKKKSTSTFPQRIATEGHYWGGGQGGGKCPCISKAALTAPFSHPIPNSFHLMI